jgi:hypothetical protein
MTMTYPPDDHRDSVRDAPLERDRRIINGSILALAAFAIVAAGIAWYAVTNDSSRVVSVKAPGVQQSVPDSTTGYGGAAPKAPAPNPSAK